MQFYIGKMADKKAVSPVIATVLLIAIVIIIALIIFLWFRSLTKDVSTKFGENVEVVCQDIEFNAVYSTSTNLLSIQNVGNIPIYGIKLKIYKTGEFTTRDIQDLSTSWPSSGLKPGSAFSSVISGSAVSGATRIILIPVLLGTSQRSGTNSVYVCEDRYGQEVLSA